jgi:elongator complex protein 2
MKKGGEMNENYSCPLISAGANTVSHGSIWVDYLSKNENSQVEMQSFLAYAAGNFVAIVDDSSKTVKYTLRTLKSESHISHIASITDEAFGCYILTGFQSGHVELWQSNPVSTMNWSIVPVDMNLSASISTICLLKYNNGILISAFDSTGLGKIWFLNSSSNQLEVLQSMKFHSHQLPNSSHLTLLSNSIPLLVLGGVDGKVHLYTSELHSNGTTQFIPVGTLIGHEEWVACLCSKDVDEKTKFIASGSQDTKIRIWKIYEQGTVSNTADDLGTNESKTFEEVEGVDDEEEEGEEVDDENAVAKTAPIEDLNDTVSAEARFSFVAGGKLFLVFLESLLVGHEDWVTSIHWLSDQKMSLFSTSMDRNMVIWSPDMAANGVWTPTVRVGDVGGALGGCVGGNLLGYVGGCVKPDGEAILGIGYGGSFHYWKKKTVGENEVRWFPVSFLTGHFDSVNDLAWNPHDASYLVSVSSDQTCRIYAPAKQSASAISSSTDEGKQWREVSRPVIHGFNLNCLALAKDSSSSFYIYTGSEEKVVRVFDAPNSVLRGFEQLCSLKYQYDPSTRVEQAYIPELGLSNKGKDTMTVQERKEQEARGVEAISWSQPPLESQLADNTLWFGK